MNILPETTLGLAVGTLGYVGPGPGLTMTGSLYGLLAILLAALLALTLRPIHRLAHRLRARHTER